MAAAHGRRAGTFFQNFCLSQTSSKRRRRSSPRHPARWRRCLPVEHVCTSNPGWPSQDLRDDTNRLNMPIYTPIFRWGPRCSRSHRDGQQLAGDAWESWEDQHLSILDEHHGDQRQSADEQADDVRRDPAIRCMTGSRTDDAACRSTPDHSTPTSWRRIVQVGFCIRGPVMIAGDRRGQTR